jgi:hypothetical protein
MTNLTAGDINASGTTGGSPYITVTTRSLAPGSSVSIKVNVQASSAQITYAPQVYSGSF